VVVDVVEEETRDDTWEAARMLLGSQLIDEEVITVGDLDDEWEDEECFDRCFDLEWEPPPELVTEG